MDLKEIQCKISNEIANVLTQKFLQDKSNHDSTEGGFIPPVTVPSKPMKVKGCLDWNSWCWRPASAQQNCRCLFGTNSSHALGICSCWGTAGAFLGHIFWFSFIQKIPIYVLQDHSVMWTYEEYVRAMMKFASENMLLIHTGTLMHWHSIPPHTQFSCQTHPVLSSGSTQSWIFPFLSKCFWLHLLPRFLI